MMDIERKAGGFTLIELMIVVVIIGVIAAIAYPTYESYVDETRRTTAQADLVELSQWMERRYSETFDYRADDGSNPDLPFDTSPRGNSDATAFYDISFEGDVGRNSYTLQAEPANAHSGDDCGTLTLDEEGNRGADGNDCW